MFEKSLLRRWFHAAIWAFCACGRSKSRYALQKYFKIFVAGPDIYEVLNESRPILNTVFLHKAANIKFYFFFSLSLFFFFFLHEVFIIYNNPLLWKYNNILFWTWKKKLFVNLWKRKIWTMEREFNQNLLLSRAYIHRKQ